ncbi:MAG: ABC-2 transporter permease [Eubacteriales bacterium]|nr:ABC-2 transporter permease [Eubacteriales bacterium]
MLWNMLKKDFLIVKKEMGIRLLITMLIPPFLLWNMESYAGEMGFLLMTIFMVLQMVQLVFHKESRYPKAAALLGAAPYPRYLMVASKYCFCIALYLICCLAFFVETLFLRKLGGLPPELAAVVFFIITVFFAFYLPVQYKLGYEKTRFIFSVVIIASPFILAKIIEKQETGFGTFAALSSVMFIAMAVAAGTVVFVLSGMISVRIFERKDLV